MGKKDETPPTSESAGATAELSHDEIREMLKRHGVEEPEIEVTDEEAELEDHDEDAPATDEDEGEGEEE